jgi:hypothetical protein
MGWLLSAVLTGFVFFYARDVADLVPFGPSEVRQFAVLCGLGLSAAFIVHSLRR